MKTIIAFVLVLPLSFLASRLGALVAGVPIAFALVRTSIWLRTTIAGFVSSVAGVAAAVAFGWFVFSWVEGPESFTLLPFFASVLLLTIAIVNDFRQSKQRAQMQADFKASGQQFLVDEIGNPWNTVVGECVD